MRVWRREGKGQGDRVREGGCKGEMMGGGRGEMGDEWRGELIYGRGKEGREEGTEL